LDAMSWTVGVVLIVFTVAMHTTGVVVMAFIGTRVRGRADKRQVAHGRVIALAVCHIGIVALILTALHGLEALLWAGGYVWLGAIGPFADAALYSNAAMTAFGVHIELPPQLAILGTMEAVNATLLFGISTAFIFALLQQYWPQLSHRDHKQRLGSSGSATANR
jgi:hypothetical protein